ncbi:MAG: tRNA uridine(34) hydroxylase [Arenicellales bacterium IbO2]|nr:MAG: tRNA uridine(34) hydroxylase [Arenicellales bacterium IbO2]
MTGMSDFVISAFYRFTPLRESGLERLRRRALAAMRECGARGSILLAPEGINGSIAGERGGVDAVLAKLGEEPGLENLTATTAETFAAEIPFKRAKVKIKKEIVTLGVPGLDARDAGERVAPEDWNALLDDEEILLVDARNTYEIAIGGFSGALNPQTENFREFPEFAAQKLDARSHSGVGGAGGVAMYCTGGIRCEKASAYLKTRGFARVFQLHGGVLNYLARVRGGDSRWRGECFVFDERVSVDRDLQRGAYQQCHACRRPLSRADLQSPHYTAGASCPHCHADTTADARARFAERQKQTELAARRGRAHLGPMAME